MVRLDCGGAHSAQSSSDAVATRVREDGDGGRGRCGLGGTLSQLFEELEDPPNDLDQGRPALILLSAIAWLFVHNAWGVRCKTTRLLEDYYRSEGLTVFHAPMVNDTRLTWGAIGRLCKYVARVAPFMSELLFSARFADCPDVKAWRKGMQPALDRLKIKDEVDFLALCVQFEALETWTEEVLARPIKAMQAREIAGHLAYVYNNMKFALQVGLAWHLKNGLAWVAAPRECKV